MKKLTIEEIRKRMSQIKTEDILISDSYVNAFEKLIFQCFRCKKYYEIAWHHFFEGQRCPVCARRETADKKVTKFEFIIEFVDANANGDILLSESYIPGKKLKFVCHICNNEYEKLWTEFKDRPLCPICCYKGNGFWNIDTIRTFIIENGCGDELIDFNLSDKKVKIKCHLCQEDYVVYWYSYLNGCRHNKCMAKKRGDERRFPFEYVYNFFKNNNYSLLSEEYVRIDEPLIAQCPIGHIISIRFGDFTNGVRCAKCSYAQLGINNRLSFDEFAEQINKINDQDVLISTEYNGSNGEIIFKCYKCGNNYKTTLNQFKQGCRCPSCSRIAGKQKLIESLISDEYNFAVINKELLEEWDWNKNEKSPYSYTPRSGQKVFWICKKCGYHFYSTIANRVCGESGCPKCIFSKGENRINKFLKENEIEYASQYRIEECKNKKQLPFDFAVWINHQLVLIEYQGRHHTSAIEAFGGEENLIRVKSNDKIKEDFCLKNNIPLIKIDYKDYKNIEEILIREFEIFH